MTVNACAVTLFGKWYATKERYIFSEWVHGRSVTEIWGRDETKNMDLGGDETKNVDLLGDKYSNTGHVCTKS